MLFPWIGFKSEQPFLLSIIDVLSLPQCTQSFSYIHLDFLFFFFFNSHACHLAGWVDYRIDK